MFRIQRAQVEFFERRSREGYLARLEEYLGSEYEECFEDMSAEETTRWLESAVAVCDRHGITAESDATQLVLLLLLLGLDADQALPWVGEALRDPVLLPSGKVRLLLAEARRRDVEGVDDVDLTDTLGAA